MMNASQTLSYKPDIMYWHTAVSTRKYSNYIPEIFRANIADDTCNNDKALIRTIRIFILTNNFIQCGLMSTSRSEILSVHSATLNALLHTQS